MKWKNSLVMHYIAGIRVNKKGTYFKFYNSGNKSLGTGAMTLKTFINKMRSKCSFLYFIGVNVKYGSW